MATRAEWVAGARPRTLPLAVAPVVLGTAVAVADAPLVPGRALLALVVAVALQVGVNYANDYSDGVRGTDAERRGPVRLTASGLAAPDAVKRAAMASFAVAAVAGTVLAVLVDLRLLLLGAAAIAAAWGYTGGRHPYGYSGWGEVAVLVFFGFAATVGSAYVQHGEVPATAWWAALVVGLPACAVLLVNNIRDVETDAAAGKRTLAVRIGAANARRLDVATLLGGLLAVVPIALVHPGAWLGLLAVPFVLGPVRLVLTAHAPPALVRALVLTVRYVVVLSLLVTVGVLL